MSDRIIFYHNPQSRASIVHWMLEEVGADYEVRLIDFNAGENRTPEFLAVNPMGKIPTVVDRGVIVTEAAAIVAYLADRFPAAGLAPSTDSPERGAYYRWLFFGAGCIEPAVVDKMFQRPEVERKGAIGYGSYDDTVDTIEKALQPGPYLLGERFSAADVYIGAQLGWAGMFGAPRIKDSPVIRADVERCTARPAYRRAKGEGADAEMEEAEAHPS